MDAEPTFQVVKKSFLETIKGRLILATGAGIIFFVILITILNYFDIFKKSSPSATGTPVKIALIPENYGFKAGDLTLNCPLESKFCKSQKLISVKKQDTLIYKGASASGVLNLITTPGLENIAVTTYQETGKKYFYESVLSKDNKSCYTIAYSLPLDSEFKDLLNLSSLAKDLPFATLGEKTFEIEGEKANVIIQVRNTPLNLNSPSPCSLIQKSPEFFQSF